MMKQYLTVFLAAVIALVTILPSATAFVIPSKPAGARAFAAPRAKLSEHKNNNDNDYFSVGLSESDQGVLGAVGSVASLVTLYSEYTLKMTGCGLPAGPVGLVGLTEGLSYLSVVGIGAFSAYTKLKQGRGLPPGPGGLLGAAEGLSFVAIAVGLVVLGFQFVDYNYIPNAVPMEGGMCN